MKIIDCTTYYSEDLMMDVRFHILNEHVDKFIVTESKYSHSGKLKPLNFDINNFPKFKDKIEYLVIENEPEDIDVVRIGWLGTRWVKWMHRASRNWSNQSRSMISMDIEQMARLMMFEGDFKKLPAASSNWRCLNCPFNADCH
mgnify:CR=1 FL=1